ncbi:multidrug effflux MFS transporter [Paraburkholderia graminis]|uniref:multidrug effflux MFS transporter n=1 Tax=Paraburkholderia graminis TaxID=60548 RepID=UPI0035B54E29
MLLVLSMLMAFASISTDLYLPALPTMTMALHANKGDLELTISGYLVGFSAGQLFWGPVSDRYGRRSPVAVGLLLFIVGCVGCALSSSASGLICWRIVQALGACASVVLSRAMVRDLYTGHRAAQMMSTLMTVMAIAPLIGPWIGSLILRVSSWHAIFWTLVGVGIFTLASLASFPETLPRSKRNYASPSSTFTAYFDIIRHRRILGYLGAGGFFYGAIFAYIAGTPFAYITYYHTSPEQYALLFAISILGIMATNQINSRLVARFGSDRLLRCGSIGVGLAGVILVFVCLEQWGGLPLLVALLFTIVSANGFIVANSIAGALATFPSRAGTVSALVGAAQYGLGIVGSAMVGLLADGTLLPLGSVIGIMTVGCAISASLLGGAGRASSGN